MLLIKQCKRYHVTTAPNPQSPEGIGLDYGFYLNSKARPTANPQSRWFQRTVSSPNGEGVRSKSCGLQPLSLAFYDKYKTHYKKFSTELELNVRSAALNSSHYLLKNFVFYGI
jgi:hypothetical protein